MKEKYIADKEAYLLENFPFVQIPLLTDRKFCLHCLEEIVVGEYKVMVDETGFEFICCPNAPECNGTLIDWVDRLD